MRTNFQSLTQIWHKAFVKTKKMARPEGFDWFEANYSIQLSYGRINLSISTILLHFAAGTLLFASSMRLTPSGQPVAVQFHSR